MNAFALILCFTLLLLPAESSGQPPDSADLKISGRVVVPLKEPQIVPRRWKIVAKQQPHRLVAAGDFNGDGRADLLFSTEDGRLMFAVARDGLHEGIDWELPEVFSRVTGDERVIAADFNADGYDDLVRDGWRGNAISLAINDRAGGFTLENWRIDLPPEDRFTIGAVGHFDYRADGADIVFRANDPAPIYWRLAHAGNGSFDLFGDAQTYIPETGRAATLEAADLDGDGASELLVPHRRDFSIGYAAVIHPGREEEVMGSYLWAHFSTSINWSRFLLLDVDGDARTDVVARGEELRHWWVGFSFGSYPVELPVPQNFAASRRWVDLLAADFDGDGDGDVLGRDSGDGSWWIGESRASAPIPGVALTLDNGLQAISNPDGRYEFADLSAGRYRLTAGLGGYTMTPAHRDVDLYEHSKSDLNFAAVRDSDRRPTQAVGRYAAKEGPYVCVGYSFANSYQKWGGTPNPCPEGYALFGGSDSIKKPPIFNSVGGSCCRLPADDILLADRKVEVESRCPDNWVAIGESVELTQDQRAVHRLVCAPINTDRYQLGPETRGQYFGAGYTMWHEPKALTKQELPAAFRYGLRRNGLTGWNSDGCVGDPIESLLVAKLPRRYCAAVAFRQLQYKGVGGDPPQGTPLKIFPDCKRISSAFDPRAHCREKPASGDRQRK